MKLFCDNIMTIHIAVQLNRARTRPEMDLLHLVFVKLNDEKTNTRYDIMGTGSQPTGSGPWPALVLEF